MQVNAVNDHVTHAVIGKNVAREAQISNSAEFFNLLSEGLYSDKLLAFIREVLCNAWDIHIQMGITDRAVQITVTDDCITIRDYGSGIHDDDIVGVYLTYGNSTKKLDGTQTGGFGLGSKSPWAYVEHFEVTSFHNHLRTMYAMSKSSGEVAGKPSVTTIMSIPTTETGLEVKVNIANRTDSRRIKELVKTIAQFGEMNVEMNGEKLDTLEFSKLPHGFMLLKQNRMMEVSGGTTNSIFIRYGNVVYPLPHNDKNYTEFSKVVSILAQFQQYNRYSGRRDNYVLILQAKPNTISVTPNRETLSMTDSTVKSVDELLKGFLKVYNENIQEECLITSKDVIAKTWTIGRPSDLLTSNNEIPGLSEYQNYGSKADDPDVLTDIRSASRVYMGKTYPQFKGFHNKEVLMRLRALEESGFGNRGKIAMFRKEYERRMDGNASISSSEWFKKNMVLPLMRKLDTVDELSGEKLLICGTHRREPRKNAYYSSETDAVVPAISLSPRSRFEDYMPFLRNFVVISYNRIDIEERLHHFPIMKNWLGKPKEMFCYIVSRTKGKSDIAVEFFEKQGMTVVDLTKAQKWEPESIVMPEPKPVVQKPRKKGLPLLSGIKVAGGYKPINVVNDDNFPRVDTPEFVVKMNVRADSAIERMLPYFDAKRNKVIIDLYGDRGGICSNDNQLDKFISMGCQNGQTFVINEISREIMTNPALQIFLGLQTGLLPKEMRQKMEYTVEEFLNLILLSPRLCKELGLATTGLTPKDLQIHHLFEWISSYSRHFDKTDLPAAVKHVEQITVNPQLIVVCEKLMKSNLINYLSRSAISTLVREETLTPTKQKQLDGLVDLLLYAIEG